jgi:hypothetical protein
MGELNTAWLDLSLVFSLLPQQYIIDPAIKYVNPVVGETVILFKAIPAQTPRPKMVGLRFRIYIEGSMHYLPAEYCDI